MFSSLGQALGWAQQRGIREEGQAITQGAGQCCGRHICEQGQNGQEGVAGALRQSWTLREDDHPPNEVALDKEKDIPPRGNLCTKEWRREWAVCAGNCNGFSKLSGGCGGWKSGLGPLIVVLKVLLEFGLYWRPQGYCSVLLENSLHRSILPKGLHVSGFVTPDTPRHRQPPISVVPLPILLSPPTKLDHWISPPFEFGLAQELNPMMMSLIHPERRYGRF